MNWPTFWHVDWLAAAADTFLITLAWLIGLAVVYAVLVRYWACNPGMSWWRDRRAAATDLLYWFALPLLVRIGKTLLVAAGLTIALGGSPGFAVIAGLPLWAQCLLILVLQDIWMYGVHRFFHTRHGWAFHAVHHSPKVLDWMSSSRFHLVNQFLSFIVADVLILLLGFSAEALVILASFDMVYSSMVHANLNWTFGPLRYVFASPVFHRWHHVCEGEGVDKNFASTFPVLDLVFGTFYMPPGVVPEHFGNGETDYPEDFWGQFLKPFLDQRSKLASAGRRYVDVAIGLMVIALVTVGVIASQEIRQRDQHESRGEQLVAAKKFDEAIAEFGQAIQRDDRNPHLYTSRAAAYWSKGDFDRAAADCDRAIELNPNLAVAYLNRSCARLGQNDLDGAIADATRAIELDAKLSEAFSNRGAAYLKKGRFDFAVDDCTKALTLNPNITNAFLCRAAAHERLGAATLAIADYTDAIRLEPNLPDGYVNRGLIFFRQNNIQKAVDDFNVAIELNPRFAEAYAYRGALAMSVNDTPQAILDCTQAIELNPNLASAYWTRAIAHTRGGNRDQAQSDHAKAIALNPALAQQ